MPSRLYVTIALLLVPLGCGRPQPPSGPAVSTLGDIAADLAHGLAGEPVTCIAVCEALGPGDGGRERSDFGTYILTPLASLLQKQAPQLRFVRLEDCPKYSPAWMRETALSKADAVLEGKYVPGEAVFELTIEVTRPLGRTLASSHRLIAATKEYRALADRRLPPIRPHEGNQTALTEGELKSELYHAAATDAGIKVAVRPLRNPVRLGGSIQFSVESSASGYVAILYQGSSGRLDFLVPNQFSDRVAMQGGEAIVVPTPEMASRGVALEASAPAGIERIKAVVSREPIAWPRDAAGNVPTDSVAKLRAIAEVLKEARFGEARCELKTEP